MSDDIQIVMTADDRDLMNSFIRQADKIQKLQEQLRKMALEAKRAGDASKNANELGIKGAEAMVGKLAGVAGGWVSATASVSAYVQQNRKAIEDSEKQAEILEDIAKKYAMIAGIRGTQSQSAQDAIRKAAYSTATSKEQAGAAAVQLVSSGMDPKEVEGGGLKAFLETLNAAGLTGKSVDSETLARSMSAYLESQGIAKTAANFRQYGAQIQRLAGPTNLGFSGINALAGEGASLALAMSPEEQLAAYAKLVGTYKEPDAATGLRNFAGRLGTASERKTSANALKAMGINPEDVDFTDEKLGTVLDRMAGGLERVPENKRDDYLEAIFGEQAKSVAATLIAGRGDVAANIATQKDISGFDRDVAFAQSGRNATMRRLQLEEEYQQAEEAGTYSLRRKAYQNAMREAGFTNFQRGVAGGIFDLASGLGASPETSQGAAQTLAFGGQYSSLNRDANAYVERRTTEALAGVASEQAVRENTASNKEVASAIRGLAPRSVPAPGPRATAGAGRP